MEEDYLELLELQALIREGVEEALPGSVRVRAEIASIQRRSNGHCYLELCESGPRGPVAKARAVIWRSTWEPIAAKFSEATGGTLHEGLSLIFQVSVSYSELYGLSLIVEDIDVGAVLGEAELARRRTIERLTQEGLMDLQKELTLPDVPYSIAVISAPDAAGYGDFRRHLLENEYGFSFAITLFPATMQGDSAPASIASALDNVICHPDGPSCHPERSGGSTFDAIFIMRGGGSNLDLACFDDYGLCAAIAQCPLPVYTAIGHDRDVHIADMVACGSVKTPTALADLCIDAVAAEDERLGSLGARLRLALLYKISLAEARIAALQARIASADPRAILSRGYALVASAGGIVIKNASSVSVGDDIQIRYTDGTLKCTVNGKV